MSSEGELVKVVEQESTALVDYLNALHPDSWNKQSACDLWTVADVTGHLVYVMEMVTGGVSRGLKGDTTPPEGWPAIGGDEAARQMFLANGGIERKVRLGEQLLPTYERMVHQAIELFTTLGPDDWDIPCYRPAGIMPARRFIRAVVTETAMHSWDIRSRLETTAHLSPQSLVVFMESMPRLPQDQSEPRLASPLRYRFDVSDPIPFHGDIVIDAGALRSEPVGDNTPDMTFRCNSETFVLLMWGRLAYAESTANGRLVADGQPALVDEFERLRSP